MQRYIITGSKGMIGEFLNRRMKQDHECVMEIDQRDGTNVLDLARVKVHPREYVDILFHLAAHCKIQEGIANPEMPHNNNANGIFQVLEFCRRNHIPRIMNFSSSRVLSQERNPYVASKIYAEEMVKAYSECYGLEFVTVRPSTVYGPCHDLTSRLMTEWCQRALRGEELPIFGDKDKTLDFTYVDDFVDGIMLLVEKWYEARNEAYNISGDEEVKLVDLAEKIIREAGGGHVGFYKPETAQPQRVKVDISRMRELGFHPKVRVQEGVRRMIEFYRRQNE